MNRSDDGQDDLRAFAHAYPAIASRLAERGDDPDVERLIEGFAYLAAKVNRMVDDGAGEALGPFVDLLAPELRRPLPSATILEIVPSSSRVSRRRDASEVAEGAEFESIGIGSTRCRFRAGTTVPLVPFRVDDARLAWSSERGHSLGVTLARASSGADGSLVPPTIRLHMAGDPRTARTLLLWLNEHLATIEIEVAGQRHTLGSHALRFCGFDANEALFPREPLEHAGFRLLREYLALPAKLAFVAVKCDVLTTLGSHERVQLHFNFTQPLPPNVQVTRESIRTNCIAVANVFETSADPVRPSLERPAHALRPAGLSPSDGEIYAVRGVLASCPGTRHAVPVASMNELGAADEDYLPNTFYALRTMPSLTGIGSEIEISLGTPIDGGVIPDVDALSLDVWATNRALPNGLGVGDVRLATSSSPEGFSFRNITALSAYRSAGGGLELQRRALSMSALTAIPLTDRDALRTLLDALDLHALADSQAARAHALRLESILDVTATPSSDVLEGAFVRGHDVLVRLGEAGFDGEGDAFLFGAVLARVFAHEASLNAYVRTTIQLAATGRVIRFPARNGDRVLG